MRPAAVRAMRRATSGTWGRVARTVAGVVVVFIVLTVLVVAAIGLVAVGGVTAKLASAPPRPLFDLAEAVDFVAERLPFDATAELSYDDVRQLVTWHLDYLQEKGVARTIEDAGGRSRPALAGEGDEDGDAAKDGGDEAAGARWDGTAGTDGLDGVVAGEDLPLVAEDDEGVAFVLGQALEVGLDVDDVQIVLVIEAEMAYLEAIGALGDPVEPPA